MSRFGQYTRRLIKREVGGSSPPRPMEAKARQVLDIACGDGLISELLKGVFHTDQVFGLDISNQRPAGFIGVDPYRITVSHE